MDTEEGEKKPHKTDFVWDNTIISIENPKKSTPPPKASRTNKVSEATGYRVDTLAASSPKAKLRKPSRFGVRNHGK